MKRLKDAFSLFELAIVLLIMGLIAAGAARTIPMLNMQSKAIKLGEELREYIVSVFGNAESERKFPAPDNFTGVARYSGYTDSGGEQWGYLAAYDLIGSGLCNIDPAQKIAVIYCKGSLPSCVDVSQIESVVQDIAFLMFSTDKSFHARLGFFIGNPPQNYDESVNPEDLVRLSAPLNSSGYANGQNSWIVIKVAAPPNMDPSDITLMDFTYQEVWDRMNCPKPKSITDGMILSLRPSSWGPVDQYYDFVPIPVNFLNIPGAEYCFESDLNRTSDMGIAKTYERDNRFVTDTIAIPPGTPTGSNFCNNLTNRVPVYRCDTPTASKWLGLNHNIDTWYKDKNLAENKWFFCGGDRMWDSRNSIYGVGVTEWYEIRVNPGRVDISASDADKYERYRNNNRTFTAYARVPGSRALYKQSFTLNIRGGMTYYWEYDK
jgi:hypothetical protein